MGFVRQILPPGFTLLCLACSIAASPTSPTATSSTASPTIIWSPCYTSASPGLACGSYEVPLDYTNPQTGNINVTFALLKATGNKIGNLHFNPGGPGDGSTVDVFNEVLNGGYFTDYIRQNYDIYGLDPRGSGRSEPIVNCNATLFNERIQFDATNETAYQLLVDYFQRLGENCANLTGPDINFVDTLSTVQDLDVLRGLLGDDKFNYFGISYGTLIGAQYAETFPERVGRFVLDGIIDHAASLAYMLYGEATGVEATLNDFFRWCDSNSTCVFSDGKDGSAAANYDALVAKSSQGPIPAPGCNNTLCRSDVLIYDVYAATQVGLAAQYSNVLGPGWSVLAEGLLAALNGNATLISPSLETSGEYSSFAILAQDWHGVAFASEYSNVLTLAKVYAPRSQAISSTSLQIFAIRAGWPAPVRNPQGNLNQTSMSEVPEMLLATSFYDPLCGTVWSHNVREQIPSGHLVMRNGAGHTSYVAGGATRDAMDDWLIEGILPADGTVYDS